jgi:glucose/arabinose dehydrogenase
MRWLTGLALIALAACGESASLSVDEGTGADPRLPAPTRTPLPTVNIARATGWGEGETPVAAAGFAVSVYADRLDHPRWLHRLPNGDVLVAETNKPAGMSGGGIMGWIEGKVMERAGAGVPSANRITLLRDANGDGVVDTRSAFLTRGLASPFGMALVGDDFYVANFREVRRYAYTPDATAIAGAGTKVVDLPVTGDKAGHWTRSLLASRDGGTLFVAVGSVSNAGENGMAVEAGRAAIHAIDLATRAMRPFAEGLRNPVGMDWNPVTGELWTAVNERDALGSDLVPDYMTSVRAGEHFGWPWVYFGDHRDARAPGAPPRARFSAPDYALGPHTASLGLAFAPDGSGVYVGQHGSWNRKPRSGYKVVFVPFADGKPAGKPRDVLTGFLAGDDARGRPVGVGFDRTGALLVADDIGNRVWRVTGPGLARAAKPSTAAE